MCNDPIIDDVTGESRNCHFYSARYGCLALKRWYDLKDGYRCFGCSFFKTDEKFYADCRAADLRLRRVCPDPDYAYDRRIVTPVVDPDSLLMMRRSGMTFTDIAEATKFNVRHVQRLIARAKKDASD